MARITGDQVKEIIETEYTGDQLEPFIIAANHIVNSYLSGQGLGESLLAEIERWLAAHLIASSIDPREQETRIGTVQVNVEGVTGMGLKFSRYGQQAMILDPTGILRQTDHPRAKFKSISEYD